MKADMKLAARFDAARRYAEAVRLPSPVDFAMLAAKDPRCFAEIAVGYLDAFFPPLSAGQLAAARFTARLSGEVVTPQQIRAEAAGSDL